MDNTEFKLSGCAALAVSIGDADKLITLGSGNAALLYIYALRAGGGFTVSGAAQALRKTESEIRAAAELLQSAGVFDPGRARTRSIPSPAEELPEYSSGDIVARTAESPEFKVIVEEAQRILGHSLSSADLKLLFGIYDHLCLPAEVIVLLINHCTEETRARLGPSGRTSMRAIEKEAYVWFNREILTLERAEEYLQKKRARQSEAGEIRRVLQISGRDFSESERQYVDSWLDMGFKPDVIALAYDKTVIRTGKLTWKYMNSILASWHEKGLDTLEAISAGDMPAQRGGAAANTARISCGSSPADDSELLRRMLNRAKEKN